MIVLVVSFSTLLALAGVEVIKACKEVDNIVEIECRKG